MSEINEMPAQQFARYWQTIWLKPRQTIAEIYLQPRHWLNWLPAMLTGCAFMIAVGIAGELWKSISLVQLLVAALMIGPFIGLLNVGILAFLVKLIGRAFAGANDSARLRLALSWSMVPAAVAIVPTVFEYQLMASANIGFVTQLLSYIRTALDIWGVLLMCMTVAEAQRLSFKNGALNVLIIFALLHILNFLAMRA